MTFGGKWVQLEIIMSSKISQTQEDECACTFSYVEPKFKIIYAYVSLHIYAYI